MDGRDGRINASMGAAAPRRAAEGSKLGVTDKRGNEPQPHCFAAQSD